MSFDILFLHCATHETNLGENKSQVSIARKAGELVLLFDISHEEAHNSYLRKEWGMGNDEPLCDGIFFYKAEGKIKICFVELKGSDFEHAVKQVVNTCKFFKNNLQKALKSNEFKSYFSANNPEYQAYIVLSGSVDVAKKNSSIVTSLKQTFGENGFYYGHNSDLGIFLRK